MSLQLIIHTKNVLTDLGRYLKLPVVAALAAEELAASVIAGKRIRLEPFEELLATIAGVTNAFHNISTTCDVLNLSSSSLEGFQTEDSHSAFAVVYVAKALARKEALYEERRKSLLDTFIYCSDHNQFYTSLLCAEAEISRIADITTANSTMDIVRILENQLLVTGGSGQEIQKCIYRLKGIRDDLNNIFLLEKERMFEDFGYMETFLFLCDSIKKQN